LRAAQAAKIENGLSLMCRGHLLAPCYEVLANAKAKVAKGAAIGWQPGRTRVLDAVWIGAKQTWR
jgi:hypothetical protein